MRTIRRPNVLLIYTDQQRRDSLGCYGNKLAKTPNLDRLAAEGARLDNYFVQNPVCMPSRMSFLTGRYCSSLGIGTNGIDFPENAVPLHQLLGPYGYETVQIGKLHFKPHVKRDHRDPHPDYGFDTFILSDEPGCYDDAYLKWAEALAPGMTDKVATPLPPAAHRYAKKAYSTRLREPDSPYVFEGDEDLTHSSFVASEMCRFLETREKSRPFFAIAGFYAPHSPINPPKRFVDMFKPKDMPLPKVGEEGVIPRLKDITNEKWQEIIAYYLALAAHVDDCVGSILETLKRSAMEENTIVIFTSDHGEFLGDHGRIAKGMPGHDCIIGVPFLVKYPGEIAPGTVISSLVEAVDMVPTVLDYCGVQTPRFVQGKSMKKLLEGEETEHKEDVLVEFFEPYGKKETTVRTKEHKYYYSTDGKQLLYDLVQDPDELRSVADDPAYAPILSEMRMRMIHRMQGAAYASLEKAAEY